ncbi:MAG: IS1380 family transposase [Desulfosarcinaceae bacterium]
MKVRKNKDKKKSNTIDEIGITSDTLASRGGLTLFVRYLSGINLYSELDRRFGMLRKSVKGKEIIELFKQIICFLIDGTSRHLSYFDQLKVDQGYSEVIETDPSDMASSHAIKRFLIKFSWPLIWMFRKILKQMFIWRLHLVHPLLIRLDIDSMVMDNDEAQKRHGVSPTYKKKKGFNPIQATWGRFIIDAVFQGGKKHCNHGDTVEKMIRHLVMDIRIHYRADVPIIFSFDSGYFDQKILELCEVLQVGYVCGGKLYKDVKEYLSSVGPSSFKSYEKGSQTWDYVEFGDKPASWSKYRRAIFCRPRYEDRQQLLEFARPDTLIYTNLGMGQRIDEQLRVAGQEDLLMARGCIGLYHGRGCNELVNRGFKDFGFEELPFLRFAPNAALYYIMLLAFFLFESFKEDVLSDQASVTSYARMIRRKVIDIAAKIVKSGGRKILKVTEAVWKALNLPVLWKKSGTPPKISWDTGF